MISLKFGDMLFGVEIGAHFLMPVTFRLELELGAQSIRVLVFHNKPFWQMQVLISCKQLF